ncbi:MAG: nucleotide pyrophosphohydrolase [Candidatus Peregrinibacteria bacterium]|nr:nucleotide pyrophosphohydrolase [Candidatus Peregrinibacteria bacterium]
MQNINDIVTKIIKFRDERDWAQFHNPKDVALSLALEASEVIEHFQWKNDNEVNEYVVSHKEEIGEELADVLYWVLLLSHDLKIDVIDALDKKMLLNEKKYPVEKSKGKHTKYNKL